MPRTEDELRAKVRDAQGHAQDFTMLFIAIDVGPLLDRLAAARTMLREREWTEGETYNFCRTCGGIHPKDWDIYEGEVKAAEDPEWDGDREWVEMFAKRNVQKPRGHADDCALAALLAAGPDTPIREVRMPEVPLE